MLVGFKLLISLAVLLIVGEREVAEARRLLKRQTVACYSGSTLLGYCYNGGSCVLVSSNLYQCLCPNGAFAIDCSTLSGTVTSSPSGSTCSPSCLNGGVCNSGICFCSNGYSGSYCQVAPSNNLCASVTCQNGGVCTVSSNLAYCNCANTGYTGPYCNILASTQVTTAGLPASGSINPCNSITCLNGGICVVIYGGGYCACASGYTGTTCQNAPATTTASTTPGACNPNPCLNNAPCLNIGGTLTCFCSTGQIPPNCATATTTTTTPATTPYNCNLLPGGNPCLNGAPCLAINNQAVCYCLPGQTPPLCTTTG